MSEIWWMILILFDSWKEPSQIAFWLGAMSGRGLSNDCYGVGEREFHNCIQLYDNAKLADSLVTQQLHWGVLMHRWVPYVTIVSRQSHPSSVIYIMHTPPRQISLKAYLFRPGRQDVRALGWGLNGSRNVRVRAYLRNPNYLCMLGALSQPLASPRWRVGKPWRMSYCSTAEL